MSFDRAAVTVQQKADAIRSRFHELIENKLAAAASHGREDAFEDLWRSHENKILRITYRITRNREDAEDALQDCFLRAYLHIQDFDGRSSFSTWLTRIAINSALMIVRKNLSASDLSIDAADARGELSEFQNVPDRGPSPEAQCAEREREEILQVALRALRPTIRQAIELQKLQGRSVKETAKIMGLSATAAKSRIHHAKVELRESLIQAGVQQNARAFTKFHGVPVA